MQNRADKNLPFFFNKSAEKTALGLKTIQLPGLST
jgi:hypothetical protein